MSLRILANLEGHSDRVWCVSWSPCGSFLASCSGDKTIRIWAEASHSGQLKWICKQILEGTHQRTIRCVTWDPSGKKLAASSFDGTTSIWDLRHGEFECTSTLEGHENEVKSVCWSPVGLPPVGPASSSTSSSTSSSSSSSSREPVPEATSLIATCSRDKSVWLWAKDKAGDFDCLSVLRGHTQDVKSVRFHPRHEYLVSCSYDDTARVWQQEDDDWYCAEVLSGHTSTVWTCAFDPDSERMVTCSDDQSLIVWLQTSTNVEKVSHVQQQRLSGQHSRAVYHVDWNYGLIVSCGADDVIAVFEEEKEQGERGFACASMVKAHSSDVNCVQWNPQRRFVLASCGDDMCVKIWAYTPKSGE